MSHLKPVSAGGIPYSNEDEVVLIPGPRGSAAPKGLKSQAKGKGKATDLFDLPEDVFASREEDMKTPQEIWAELQGLQPDMDPHLRQVLEALEDDAFVGDEEDEEDWFGELVGGGETAEGDREEYEFEEWGIEGDDVGKRKGKSQQVEGEGREETWEDRFKAFKESGKATLEEGSLDGDAEVERSEMADTLGSMVSGLGDLTVKGGKKRRGKRGPSDASGMSMSSSSMFRNAGLRDLDDRFDKVRHGI
jgi:protein LTV1